MNRPTRRQRLTLTILVLVSLTLATIDYRGGGGAFAGVRSGAAAVFGPVQRTASNVLSPVGEAVGGLPELGRARRDAKRLREENAQLRAELRANQLDRTRLEQLRKVDLLAGLGRYQTVRGQVVALGRSLGFEWTATVDLGRRDGVKVGMTVIDGDGLVGRVKTAGPYTSVVLLAVDPLSSVGSRMEGSGELGITRGQGRGPLQLQLLDPQVALRTGDRLVTGPFAQSTYTAGVPIGVVTRVHKSPGALVRTADIDSYVDFSALDVVAVVTGSARTDPRDRLLPPKPTGTPSAVVRPRVAPTGR